MKTGKMSVVAIYVACPHCEEAWEGSDGSQMLSFSNGYEPGKRVVCPHCGEPYRLPLVKAMVG